MTKHDDLTPRQRRVIAHLVSSLSVEAACADAGISKNTVYTWLKQPSFKAALEEARNEAFRDAMVRLKATLTRAVDTLSGLLDSTDASIRLQAATRLIGYAIKVAEVEDLQKRLEELERRLSAGGR